MFGSNAVNPGVRMAFRCAYAAGLTGILADLCLITVYVSLGLLGGGPGGSIPLASAFHAAGAASDLLASPSTAFMIPVALFLGQGPAAADGTLCRVV